MRKVLSIVITLLMVSMMIPSMAFAADSDLAVADAPSAALVAGESFVITPTSASANVTVKVNANVFALEGENITVEGKIESATYAANTAVTITVETSIPEASFVSKIRVEDENGGKVDISVTVDDRLVGDTNNDALVNLSDALQIVAYFNGQDVVSAFNMVSANADGIVPVNLSDALQIVAYFNEQTVTNEAIGTAYLGGNDTTVDVTDPDYDATTSEPTVLDTVSGIYAYYQASSGLVYYQFDAVTGAENYTVTISSGETATVNNTSGSIAVAAPAEGTTLTITIVANAEGAESSAPATVNVVEAAESTALSDWLAENGLTDVVITVYEIQ